MPHLLCLFHFLLLVTAVFARMPGHEFTFSNLNTSDGLSHNCVTSICQDSCGFLWLGTYDGLNLYDGYHFKIYRHIQDDPTTLSGNHIRRIVNGHQYNQWVLTDKGLDRFHLYTEKIIHYSLKERILDIKYSPKNDLLVLTSHQLYRYFPLKDTLIPAISTTESFTTFTEDQRGQLYLGTTQHSIQVYSPTFHFVKELQPLPDKATGSSITHLHADTENRLWIAFAHQALGKYDSLQQNYQPIALADYTLIDPNIRTIQNFDSLHLIIGAFNGLFLLNKNTGQVTPTSPAIGQEGELSHFSIYSLCKDRQGTLWVGTNNGGVNFYSYYYKRFGFIHPTQYSGLIGMGREDQQGKIWFATEGGGLLCYDPVSQQQHNYLLNADARQAFNNNIIKAIHISGDSIFCTTHQGKVYLFSMKTRQYKLWYDFKYNNIPVLYKDTRQNLWIATNTQQGLVRWRNGHFTNKFRINGQIQSLYQVTVITEISPGKLLFGTERGIVSYDSATDSLTSIPAQNLNLPSNTRLRVTAILTDSQENIWVAIAHQGLFMLDQHLNLLRSLTHLTAPEEKILSLTESPDGQIWFTTNRKLFRYHPGKNTCSSFDAFNGMVAQEFSPNSAFLNHNGQLYLPGNKGITTVNTHLFPSNPEIPPICLTTLRINNRQVTPQSHPSLLSHSLRFTSSLTLRHKENSITLGYTALNYIYPLSNRYAYYLEGFDRNWIQAGGSREAVYNNLPPGNYTFHVKASNNDGIWNTDGPVLHLRILPPLWQRWWACLIYLLVLFVLPWYYWMYRQRKLALEQELRSRKLPQEQSEKPHPEGLKEIYDPKLSLKSAGIEIDSIDKKFMEQYIAIIRQNISNPDFNIENLCHQLGMSRAAFYRKIKTVTSLSPAEMIRKIRLECACELLKTTSLSAAEIAFQVGFGSYAHFSTYFKATYGVSPKVYKEKTNITQDNSDTVS